MIKSDRAQLLEADMSNGEERARRRSRSAHDNILAATYALLQEIGFGRLTIEGIAARAGVGKATIYRWWPTKAAVAIEAFLTAIAPALAFPHTDSARHDIQEQIRRVARAYASESGRIVREMIGSGLLDRETIGLLLEGYLKPRRETAAATLRRGIANGEFRQDFDMEAVLDCLYAPLFHRLEFGHAPLDNHFADTITTLVLGGIASRTGQPATSSGQ